LEKKGDDLVKNENNRNLFTGLIQLLFSLTALFIIIPVVTSTYTHMTSEYPLWTKILLMCMGAALLLSSKKRRDTALHFIYQVTRLESLMMVEGEEARMLEERENQAGETRSLDFWR